MRMVYESPPLTLNENRLSISDIRAFVIYKFSKGAKCFNGEWWGGTHLAVFGSQYGFDVKVIRDSGSGLFVASAYPYTNLLRDIDMLHPLVKEFELGFHVEVNYILSGWEYVLYVPKEQIKSAVLFEKEKEAHLVAGIELNRLLEAHKSKQFVTNLIKAKDDNEYN